MLTIDRLTIDFHTLFQHAGFANAKHVHVFELMRDARSRQITADHRARIRRDTALGAVLSLSTPNMRLWTSALQNLLQVQRACPSSPLQKGQIRDHFQVAVAAHYSHLAADPIWTSPDTDTQAILDWLRRFCPTQDIGRFTTSIPSQYKPYCKACRVRHPWAQHVSSPATTTSGNRGTSRPRRHPKASGAELSDGDTDNDH